MPRANRFYTLGGVWHVTHRCHNREFLLKFARDRLRHGIFLPIVLPILLTSLRAVAAYPGATLGTGIVKSVFDLIGHPIATLRCHTLGTLVTGVAGMTTVAVLYYLFA
jgi:hypothetical protein